MQISINNLSKKFSGKSALKDVNLTIDQGMFGLLGRNGAGKTTLMRILATLINKSSGEINICGIDILKTKELRKLIGYLPQDFSVYPNLSVYEAMDYLGVLSEVPSSERKKIIPELLEKVNLLDCKKVKVKALSGGMKRRLGIAQAILHNPKVLIVDEPTAGLDPKERIRFRNLLCELAKDKIVILSTHIIGDIEATCKNIGILDNGSLIFKGTVQELKSKAEGKVFSMNVNPDELERIKQEYIITGMIMLGDSSSIRVISDVPPSDNAQICEPNIEDSYMLMIGGIDNV
ncbi:ABC transporter ATP-binding protein [Clostridium tagluense]|uniref:ABC transporter ATP-binding protein n=1 Tax=Clostridium tagluense TaxID=360422 RepID=UPI001C0CE28C|nr:ABC transporter ATP-binding protein [Clostridium tagluense]MBU3130594.1 ABC transporter ATP-binding protein [Clostridium tagluense]MCB2314207.1 ABC transporter ATP-binding protein [Clostridium tagluense]MCB2319073.1 ABC transporter ATP-binding protein [Clostridium tagluense]MCB2323941.1 ABC transporter ATP-binding protein [Clostridium tagluense]MCB2328803.1 ABC transporter ATP-binding protein [Clostridium tagluense]